MPYNTSSGNSLTMFTVRTLNSMMPHFFVNSNLTISRQEFFTGKEHLIRFAHHNKLDFMDKNYSFYKMLSLSKRKNV
jgi:predicted adenine nucleotide alpha hydrolase (AANH) superfamily ATPase